jgi:hypothetical protein
MAPAKGIIGRLSDSYKIALTTVRFAIPIGWLAGPGNTLSPENFHQYDRQCMG